MILTPCRSASRFFPIHPYFEQAFSFLGSDTLLRLQPGTYELRGKDLYAIILSQPGTGKNGAVLEAHRRYIDIQYTVQGIELIGWAPVSTCVHPKGRYAKTKDCRLFKDTVANWVTVVSGECAIFFPEDAHAPLSGKSMVRKAVVKVRI